METFTGIFVPIACWDRHSDWPQMLWHIFQIQQLCIHLYLRALVALFSHGWVKGIYLARFCFCVFDSSHKIKTLQKFLLIQYAKICSYTNIFKYSSRPYILAHISSVSKILYCFSFRWFFRNKCIICRAVTMIKYLLSVWITHTNYM